ncbi:histidine-rich glycoprotein-like [Lytechinus variegatus]|uniref:histidine-rich glycoprotein-like n=1 Tax=Lytechinus variegatus TaxID=7654 RepID=UPI001BB1664F|nr:histidine-rich glycoprotein-like [Lytechinus variegatus]
MPQRWIPTSRRDPGYDFRHELDASHHEGAYSNPAQAHHPRTIGGTSHQDHHGMSTHPLARHGPVAGGRPLAAAVSHVSPHHDPHPIREGEISLMQHRVIPDHPHLPVIHPQHDIRVHGIAPPHPHPQNHPLDQSHPHGNVVPPPPAGHPHPSSHPEHGHSAPHHDSPQHHDAPPDHHPDIHSHHPTASHSSSVPVHHAATTPHDHAHLRGFPEHEGGTTSHLHHPTNRHPYHHSNHHLYSPHHQPGLYPSHPDSSHHPSPTHPNLITHHYRPFYTSHHVMNPDMAYPLTPLYHHGYASHYPYQHLHPWMVGTTGRNVYHMDPQHLYQKDHTGYVSHHHFHTHRHHFDKEAVNIDEMPSHTHHYAGLDRSHAHHSSHLSHPDHHQHHGLHRQGAFYVHHHESHVDHHDDYDSPDGAASSRHHHQDHHRHHPQGKVDGHRYGEVSFGTDATKFHVTVPLKPGFKPEDVIINVQLHGDRDLHVEFRHDHHDPRVQTSRILRHIITLPDHVDIDSLRSTLNHHGSLIIDGVIKTEANMTPCHNIDVEVIEHREECAAGGSEQDATCEQQKGNLEENK